MCVARNILLFTLIIDYEDSSNIWKIFYHLFLDNESLELLHIQIQKLLPLSASIQCWHNSRYGRLLRICDQGTLLRVRRIWNSFSSSNLSGDDQASYNKRFESGIQTARDMQAHYMGPGMNLTGFRSAAPISNPSLNDLSELFQHFWQHGVTSGDRGSKSKSRIPNPMFAGSLGDAFILHYGTDPLLGFHLATAYASLTSGSPLESSGNLHLHKVVAAARLQFRKWCASFRKDAQKNLTIRFFAGDALAFCHTLQHMHTTGDRFQSNWYRDQYHLEALILDGEDYASNGNAPLLFNVIDTSNLLDHVGAINILVAASPLLESSICATLYTEALVKKQEDLKALVDDILCGHFPTLSILFGLIPIEYWTNSTATSRVAEHLLDTVTRMMGHRDSNTGQMHSRLTWKRFVAQSTAVPVIRFDGPELAHILYQFYQKMFQNEDMTQLFSKINLQTIHNSSLLHYHRGSLASFLRFVKQRVVVDWNETMNVFIGLVENNSTLLMSRNYMQELYLQLHLLDLHTVSTFRPPFKHIGHSQALKGLSAWKEIPAVVCINLKVPRDRLRAITEVPLKKLGTPILHCILQSSSNYPGRQWQNIFAVVQLAFGDVTTSGSRCDDGFRVSVSEDVHSWNGHSSLLVSFVAPSWVVLLEPHAATVAVGVQSTPQSSHTFMNSLGVDMNIYETTLGNEENVYMTKYRPNLLGHASVCNFEEPSKIANKHTDEEVATIVKASVDIKTGQITALIGRLDILSESVKSSLRNGAPVETVQTSPCTVSVAIGKAGPKYHLFFPVPVQISRSRSRIARKSSYIEVIAPMADPRDGGGFPHFMCPMFPSRHGPVIWNMPRLNLDCLPILDTSNKKELEWLTTHVSFMLSSRERHLRDKSMASGTAQQDARINFKDSLFSLFMHFSGLQGQHARIFGINNPGHGGIHILVFVSCLRLDLANHTVVLDATILPLHDPLMPKLRPFLEKLTGVRLCNVTVDDDELRLWKEMIPAWVERCRQWEHRPSCEYLSRSKIPLSVEFGQNPICSCGEGTLPPRYSFDLPRWKLAVKYMVQAAISPSFSVPFVEQNFEGNKMTEPAALYETGCRLCGKGNSGDGGKGLLRCSRCQAVRYCSVECQRADWKEHKKVCKN